MRIVCLHVFGYFFQTFVVKSRQDFVINLHIRIVKIVALITNNNNYHKDPVSPDEKKPDFFNVWVFLLMMMFIPFLLHFKHIYGMYGKTCENLLVLWFVLGGSTTVI